jgi:hypothetical protein
MPMGVYQHFHVSWCGPSVVLLVVVVVVVEKENVSNRVVFLSTHEPLVPTHQEEIFFQQLFSFPSATCFLNITLAPQYCSMYSTIGTRI